MMRRKGANATINPSFTFLLDSEVLVDNRNTMFQPKYRPSSTNPLVLVVVSVLVIIVIAMGFFFLAKIMSDGGTAKSSIVVARTEIEKGTVINESMIRSTHLPARRVYSDSITSPDKVIGRITLNRIPAHAQIRDCDLEQ